MKSKYITHIILEGCDGVGKDTILSKLWPLYNFKYRVYCRGEISDFVYAKKFGREFISTQRGLPFLYVVIIKDKNIIKEQIIKRDIDVENELKKVEDQQLFIEAAYTLAHDYHIIILDITGMTLDESVNYIYNSTIEYIKSLTERDENNEFNKMYIKGASKLGKDWYVKGGQTFLDDDMIMADAQLHNGRFETYSDKTIPHNLIFSYGYDYQDKLDIDEFYQRPYDFAYPINSKILVRHEIYDYINELNNNNLLLMTTDSKYIPQLPNIIRKPKVFGDDYIKMLSKAKATFYCSRDLAYLKMMTVRCYEATRANQIIFVDHVTDPGCEILTQIHGGNKKLIKLLYCSENTLANKYKEVLKNKKLVETILKNQIKWYNKLITDLKGESNEQK